MRACLACLLPAGLPVNPVPIRIAFFNVEVCNSGLAVTDSAAITNTLYTDPHSLKNYWRQASNNRAYMDETTSAVINLRLPCSRFPITTCDVGSWYEYARGNPSALGGRVFSQYQFQVSRLTHSLSRCPWVWQVTQNQFVSTSYIVEGLP